MRPFRVRNNLSSFMQTLMFIANENRMNDHVCNTLPPLKQRHERKTFATPTLKVINSRLQYYRQVLSQPEPLMEKAKLKRQRIQNKYNQCMKVRNLLNRAVKNLYI